MASFVSGPVIGPLAPFAEGFIAQLANLSYSTQAVKSHRGLLVHLSQWLAERGLGVRELTPEVSAKFLQMRRDAGFVTKVLAVPRRSSSIDFGVISSRNAAWRRTS